MVGTVLDADPAIAGLVRVSSDNTTLTLALSVLTCDEYSGTGVCGTSDRKKKAVALATLLPRGIVSAFNVTSAGAKLKLAVTFQGVKSLPLSTTPKCSLYRTALDGNALYASVRTATLWLCLCLYCAVTPAWPPTDPLPALACRRRRMTSSRGTRATSSSCPWWVAWLGSEWAGAGTLREELFTL